MNHDIKLQDPIVSGASVTTPQKSAKRPCWYHSAIGIPKNSHTWISDHFLLTAIHDGILGV